MIEKEILIQKIEVALERLRSHITASFSKEILAKIPADDIVQETFAKAIVAADDFEFRGDYQLFAWLKQIANNYTISLIRSPRSKGEGTLMDSLVDSGLFTPSSIVRKKELIQAIKNSLDQLDPHQQDILRLRYEDGKSFVQIATELDLSDVVVRGRHRNCLQILRRKVSATGVISSIELSPRGPSEGQ